MKPSTRTPNSQFHSAVSSASSPVPEDHHSHHVHQLPIAAPVGPTTPKASFTATFRSVFQRSPNRAPSSNSLQSAYSAAASSVKPPQPNPSAANDYKPLHPYAAMVAAPLPVVASHDATEEEDDCPVCLEPLSFSFRLPGEKPHIVPECGHALHEVSRHFRSSFISASVLPRALPSCPPALLVTATPAFAALLPLSPTLRHVQRR